MSDIPAELEQPAVSIAYVVDEVRQIRDKVLADRKIGVLPEDWDAIDSNEHYINEVIKKHPELGGGYPILVRECVQNPEFTIRTVKKYLKWVSKNPDPKRTPDDNPFMRIQAQYYYFEELQRGVGRGNAQKAADAAYKELVSAEDHQRKFIDERVAEYYRRVKGAKSRIIEKLKKQLPQIEKIPGLDFGSSSIEAPSDIPADEPGPADEPEHEWVDNGDAQDIIDTPPSDDEFVLVD